MANITPSPSALHEPPMFLQRPSSAKSQDVQHVLAKTFRQLFTRDAIAPDTVHYLNKSRGGDDAYHEKYVEALQQVQQEREKRMAEASMLERHIMQAQARAMSSDERELNRTHSASKDFPDLGLPPTRAYFKSCIDNDLLRSHNLIVPEDYAVVRPLIVPPPSAPIIPQYARETTTSQGKHLEAGDIARHESPFPDAGSDAEDGDSESDLESLDSLPRIIDSRGAPGAGKENLWKLQPHPHERERERKELANLQGRIDYLKNPRHLPPSAEGASRSLIKSNKKRPKEMGIKPIQEQRADPPEPSTIFVANPATMVFTNYDVGQMYELTLELKNVTTVLRPIRVLPPKTSYCSIGLGQFPGEHGLIAPGMVCHYTIRFAPDSLGDYDDEIVVQTQSSHDMVIQIQGRRPPPVLTMSKVLDVGQCLVGGVKIAQFEIKNDGGTGRFALMKKSQWPASNFKSVTSMGAVTIRPFEIRPSVFELKAKQSMMLEVLFVPQTVETFSHPLTMVCDNCHVHHMEVKGEGQVASVELEDVEDGLSEPQPDELCDITAQHLIKFANLNPFTYVQRTVTVKNIINVDLPYSWIIVKPYIRAQDPEFKEEIPIPNERIQDVDTAFNIEPDQGTLKANQTTEFVVTFAPPMVNSFHSVLHLVLQGIPKPRPESGDSSSKEQTDKPAQERSPQPLGGRQRRLSSQDNMESPMIHVGEPDEEDVTALEIETKGICEPLSVMLQPYAIHVPGQLMMQTTTKKQFRMINNSITVILFQWDNVCIDDLILEVEPPLGELLPHSEMDFDLTIVGSKPGRISRTLTCSVQHLDTPLTLNVDLEIKGPEVIIEQSNVNLGLVRLGETVETKMSIRNTSCVAAFWSIFESPVHQSDGESEFIFEPVRGELRPLESQDIKATFRPRKCQSLRSVFKIHVRDGSESAIAVLAEVQSPTACLLTSHVTLDEAYINVPFAHDVQLLNQTLLPTTFEWGQAEGSQTDMCSISVEPQQGTLDKREQKDITVYFTAHTTGEILDVRVPCVVAGMERPIYLALSSNVKGLSVTYAILDENKQECACGKDLAVNFGAVNLGCIPKRYIILKNESAIAAPYQATVGYFDTRPPTPPGKPLDAHLASTGQRRTMLARTPNLADPLSKTPAKHRADVCKMMLKEGKGVAFSVNQPSGILPAFSSELLEITAFSDMWGEYTDEITFTVERLEAVTIPVKMSVFGCPLIFQMCAANPTAQPVLRFGTQVSGIPPCKRQMRVNNTSPFDIRLDWQVFNKEHTPDHLVDFIVTYGAQFPRKDADGEEIVPQLPGPTPLERLSTDMIPNSPETAPTQYGLSKDTTFMTSTSSWDDEMRPKVISVTMREHDGVQSHKPYAIIPDQIVVPGRSHAAVNLSFTAFPNEEVSQDIDCIGYALGYLSLTDKVACVENLVSRDQGYGVDPLRLQMTGQVKPATVNIECTDEEGMRYRGAASDLMHDGKMMRDAHKLSSTTITNNTLTPLEFRVRTQAPFHIVLMDKITERPRAMMTQTQMSVLNPRQNMLVQVSFRVSLDLLEYIDILTNGDEEEKPEGIELEETEVERKLHFRSNMVVEFNNTTTQTTPLHATLVIPAIHLSKQSLDFGTCLVGQRREIQFTINNPTASTSYWVANMERKSGTCVENTFELTPSSGMLAAHVSFAANSKTIIRVFFTAKHAEDYEAVFLFHGMLGEIPQQLHVKAIGSYDGKHEALLNV